ncbi:hypothetical protein ASE63_18250 [Bosea sp. Root381]|uniref:hypothetical protein n=1 Tax=Bosea sp. Root381 TaxID=1736524 RepID=UPI0007023436|nr:hypothetical protein [Bosea sp. Root381]KRE13939.1 hypothetical protein ASE63_18250 [Bosea sp. Root381]
MKRVSLAFGLVLGLAAMGTLVLPPGWQHWELLAAADDPVALSDLRLRDALSTERIDAEMAGAIAARDTELADSLIALASERGIAVPMARRSELQALKDGAMVQAVADFGHGFVAGDRESGAAFAGALVGDITGYGDVRDLALEGRKWLGGESADATVLAIAAAGLAISAATWASFGGALPARNGLSAVKAASKAKLLSPALTANLTRAAAGAIDQPALRASLAAASRFDIAAARVAAGGIVKPAAMARFASLGQDAGTVYARTGQRGLRQVLGLADDAGDIGKAAKLGAAKGSITRGILKVLGRGALVLGALSLSAVGWMLALIGYVIALAMLAQRFGWWLGRRLFPPRRTA